MRIHHSIIKWEERDGLNFRFPVLCGLFFLVLRRGSSLMLRREQLFVLSSCYVLRSPLSLSLLSLVVDQRKRKGRQKKAKGKGAKIIPFTHSQTFASHMKEEMRAQRVRQQEEEKRERN